MAGEAVGDDAELKRFAEGATITEGGAGLAATEAGFDPLFVMIDEVDLGTGHRADEFGRKSLRTVFVAD